MKKESKKLNRVIILKGSPGVGKSYISRKLIPKLKNSRAAIISIDEVLHFDQRSLKEDKLKLAKFHAAIMARSFLREGFDIIIDYTFDIVPHLEFLIDKIQHSHTEVIPECKLFIFHLTADIKDVTKRNKTRRDGSDPLPEGILKRLYNGCEKTIGKIKDEIVIDTTKNSSSKIVNQIIEAVK